MSSLTWNGKFTPFQDYLRYESIEKPIAKLRAALQLTEDEKRAIQREARLRREKEQANRERILLRLAATSLAKPIKKSQPNYGLAITKSDKTHSLINSGVYIIKGQQEVR